MFRESLIETSRATRARRGWATLASFGVETAAIAALVLVPLIYTEALPRLHFNEPMPPPPAARQVGGPIHQRTQLVPVPTELRQGQIIEPRIVPRGIYMPPKPEVGPADVGASQCSVCVIGSVGEPDSHNSNVITQILLPARVNATIPPPPVTVVRVSKMNPGMLVARIEPRYPVLAVQTRTQGQVVLAAVIGRDGRIENLHAVSGHPLLIPSALDAVRQWRYRPTMLNGQPVEVETQITVNFRLDP